MNESILYRLEFYPPKGTFHTTPSFTEFKINKGWIVISYQEEPEYLLSFTNYIHELFPKLKDGIEYPVLAEEIQANWLFFKYKTPFSYIPSQSN